MKLTAIDNIVAEIYTIFSGNKPLMCLDACTHCCMSLVDARKIKSYPLREIPLELLKEYQDAAKPNVLDFGELKYFAPRYLELVGAFQFPSFEPLLSLSRFGYFKYTDWTSVERDVLDRYSIAFLRKFIDQKPCVVPMSPMDLLLMFHQGNFDVALLFSVLEKLPEQKSLRFFLQLLDGFTFTKDLVLKVEDSFADEKFNTQICSWIESKRVKKIFKQKIEKAIMNPEGNFTEEELEEMSWKYEMMQ